MFYPLTLSDSMYWISTLIYLKVLNSLLVPFFILFFRGISRNIGLIIITFLSHNITSIHKHTCIRIMHTKNLSWNSYWLLNLKVNYWLVLAVELVNLEVILTIWSSDSFNSELGSMILCVYYCMHLSGWHTTSYTIMYQTTAIYILVAKLQIPREGATNYSFTRNILNII